MATEAIVQSLPNLRRYARALSGSQNSGDAYVAAALEALAQDSTLLSGATLTGVALVDSAQQPVFTARRIEVRLASPHSWCCWS